MFDVDELLRQLAKSNKYQTLFAFSKESGFPFFRNNSDYTDLQISFLNFLGVYYNLTSEIAMDNVDRIVLTDRIYEDAYMYWKNKHRLDYLKKENQQTDRELNKKESDFSWLLKRPKK